MLLVKMIAYETCSIYTLNTMKRPTTDWPWLSVYLGIYCSHLTSTLLLRNTFGFFCFICCFIRNCNILICHCSFQAALVSYPDHILLTPSENKATCACLVNCVCIFRYQFCAILECVSLLRHPSRKARQAESASLAS